MAATMAQPRPRRSPRAVGAGVPILESKITIPSLPTWCVPRKRVMTLISAGTQGPVTLLAGPPGSGKTMALASWAARMTRSVRIAWVSLDTFDNQPETFWLYVTEALRRSELITAADLPATARKQPGRFLPELAVALAGRDSPAALVLDDFHLLTDRRILDGLTYLIRHVTSDVRLLLASRAEPSLAMQRHRLAGDLTEIRAEDLAFRFSETAALMGCHGVTVPPEALVTLTRRSAGWPAALRLTALAMAARHDPEGCIAEMAAPEGAIAHYFGEEVLGAQPAHVRDLLFRTSILGRVNAGLAGALAKNGNAGQTLPALAQANEFVQPVGGGWYKYHPLFADVLRQQLQHESPGKVAKLHRAAARWLWRNGCLQEGVAQAAAAGDWALATRMTVDELAVSTLIDPEAGQPLAAVLHKLRISAAPQQPPYLIVIGAMALRQGQDGVCLAWLAKAERLLGRLPADAEIPSRMAVAMIRMDVASRRGDFDMAATAAVDAASTAGKLPADLLTRHPRAGGQEPCWRGPVQMWGGHFDDAAATFAACPASGNSSGNCGCPGRRVLVEVLRGRLSSASRLAFAPGATSADDGAARACPPDAAREIALAYVGLERHRLDAAVRRLSMANRALRVRPDKLLTTLAQLATARLELARGRVSAAAELAAQARNGWSPPFWLEERLALVEAQARALTGDIETAVGAAARAGSPSTLPGALALARVRLAAGDPAAAARTLAAAAPALTGDTADLVTVEALLLQAELWCLMGHPDGGRLALKQALSQAGKEQLLLPFAGLRGGWIEPVLRRNPDLAGAFQRLFQRSGHAAGWAAAKPPSIPATPPATAEPLSERELEVLQYVSKMLSTEEIAREMQRSSHTVKSHLKNIFRKLGVDRRREAVHRAQQLGIL